MLFVGLFAAFALGAFSPFSCYKSPNGKSVMQSMPSIQCDFDDPDTGGEYTGLWLIGMFTFLLYPCGGLGYLSYAIWRAPQSSLEPFYIRSHRFLFFRFRPDRYYWMPCLLLRNTLVGVPSMVFDVPQDQALLVICILLSALGLQIYHWPWRSKELNFYDAFSVYCIIMVLGFWFPTAEPIVGSTRGYSAIAAGILFLLFTITAAIFARIFFKMKNYRPPVRASVASGRTDYKSLLREDLDRQQALNVWVGLVRHFQGVADDQVEADIAGIMSEMTK